MLVQSHFQTLASQTVLTLF